MHKSSSHSPAPRSGPDSEVVRATKRINAECAEKGDTRGARALIESLILSKGLLPSLVTANILIKTYRAARDPQGAEDVLQQLGTWGLRPDGCTFSTLVDAYGLAGRVNDAWRMVDAAEGADAADSRVYSALLRFVPADGIDGVMARLGARRIPYDTALCNAALSTFASVGRAADARAFVAQHMDSPTPRARRGMNTNATCGSTAAAAQQHPPPRAAPDTRTSTLLLKAHCTAGEAAQAAALLEEMLEPASPHRVDAAAVSTVMNAHVSLSPPDLPTAYRLMRLAGSRGVVLDVAIYNILIKGYAATVPPQPERAEALLDDIRSAKLAPTVMSIATVMDAWCEVNKEAQAADLMHRFMHEGVIRPTTPLYNTLIKASSRCRCKRARGECLCDVCGCCNPDRGMELLQQMAVHGLQPDGITISTLLDAFCSAAKLPQAWMLLESLVIPQASRRQPHGKRDAGGGSSAAFQPTLANFSTLFRGTLREASRRTRGGPPPAKLGCAVVPRPLGAQWLLEQFDSGLSMMDSLGLHPDAALGRTLQALAVALHVELPSEIVVDVGDASRNARQAAVAGGELGGGSGAAAAGFAQLRAAVHHAAQCAAALPDNLLNEAAPEPSRAILDHAVNGSAASVSSVSTPQVGRHETTTTTTELSAAAVSSASKSEAVVLAAAPGAAPSEDYRLAVDGLHCGGCCETLRAALAAVAGVSHVDVCIEDEANSTGFAKILGDRTLLLPSALLDAAAAAGKSAELVPQLRATSASAEPQPASVDVVPCDKNDAAIAAMPLSADERKELIYLRARVAELESAMSSMAHIARTVSVRSV